MIVRLVKLTFKVEEIETFKSIFESSKDKIRAFPGVQYLALLQDQSKPNIFFTKSHWRSAEDLENYRNSDLFKKTWAKTKPLFAEKAEAWSTTKLVELN